MHEQVVRGVHLATAVLAIAFGAAALASPTDTSITGELTIRATGFKHAHGHAVAKLFAPPDNVLGRGRWESSAPIDAGVAAFRFSGLPAGRYAAVVFHDENDNSIIDHGMFGPSEPLGFSGGFALTVLSGLPDFEKLQFQFTPPGQVLEVTVR